MPRDENTYGFSLSDARELINTIGGVDREYPEGRPRGGGGGDKHYLFTLTATMASGSGACTIRNMADDAEIATSQTVVDTLGFFDGLASGQRGICIRQGGVYYAIGPYVTSVRWDDPDLEYSKDDATTWVTIDTAEECA